MNITVHEILGTPSRPKCDIKLRPLFAVAIGSPRATTLFLASPKSRPAAARKRLEIQTLLLGRKCQGYRAKTKARRETLRIQKSSKTMPLNGSSAAVQRMIVATQGPTVHAESSRLQEGHRNDRFTSHHRSAFPHLGHLRAIPPYCRTSFKVHD